MACRSVELENRNEINAVASAEARRTGTNSVHVIFNDEFNFLNPLRCTTQWIFSRSAVNYFSFEN